MRIVITGTPGTGKSTIAKRLSKNLGLELVDLSKIAREQKIVTSKQEVDVEKLTSTVTSLKNKNNFVVEGHLACEVRIPADYIFVLRCNPKILNKRISKRKYSKRKISDNLMAEMLDYCTQRVELVYGKKPLELDTSKRSVNLCLHEIENSIKHKKKRIDSIDYSGALKDFLKLR